MKPDQQDVFFQLIVSGGGEFIYDSNGNLREAGVGATTTDPVQGLTCPAGRSFWNGFGAILLLISDANDAIFQYFDNGSAVQGALVFSGASALGIEPVTGQGYGPGQTITNPAFGTQTIVLGATVDLLIPSFSQNGRILAQQGGGATSPYVALFGPEQGVSGHLVMLMQGTSPDGTHLGQLLIAREPTGFTSPAPVTNSLLELQGSESVTGAGGNLLAVTETGGAPGSAPVQLTGKIAGDRCFAIHVTGDITQRLAVFTDGSMRWGDGTTLDATLARTAANLMKLTAADLDIGTAGRGLQIAEGANARMGTAVLAGGTVVVNNTSVTANTRIFLTAQTSGAAPGALRVSARTAGTSFTITSTSATDTSTVAWLLVEPG